MRANTRRPGLSLRRPHGWRWSREIDASYRAQLPRPISRAQRWRAKNQAWMDVVVPVVLVGLLAVGMVSYDHLSRPAAWTDSLISDTSLSVMKGQVLVQHANGTRVMVEMGPRN